MLLSDNKTRLSPLNLILIAAKVPECSTVKTKTVPEHLFSAIRARCAFKLGFRVKNKKSVCACVFLGFPTYDKQLR